MTNRQIIRREPKSVSHGKRRKTVFTGKILLDGSFDQQMAYMRQVIGLKPDQSFADLDIPDEDGNEDRL